MKKLLLSLSVCLIISGYDTYGQSGARGVTVVNTEKNTATGKTWAIIIGISAYQNIDDLQYAHKDAEAFYKYLRMPQVNVPAENIKLLLNEGAASTEIFGALDWLTESVKENDRVIFYFSGHGDVEKKTIYQNGFLLAYDSPTSAYMTKGTIGLAYLQSYLDSYIVKNKAKDVLLIVDACKSGKLAGGMPGVQATMKALNEQWNGQITKILSAQEGELSLEDAKWGTGRGVFSYYFIKGIQGLANKNVNDHAITTFELINYLPLIVAEETSFSQNPKIEGDLKRVLFTYDEALLAEAKKVEVASPNQQIIAAVKPKKEKEERPKGFADELDSAVNKSYNQYVDYVKKGWLLWGNDSSDTINCALYAYNKLLDNPAAISIRPSLKSSFLAALQRGSQNTLDAFLKAEDFQRFFNERIVKEINYAGKIIDESHILFQYIKSRSLFYEATTINDPLKAIKVLKAALKLEPDAPYIYYCMADRFDKAKQIDSAIFYYHKAITIAPSWIHPYNNLAAMLKGSKYFKKAETFYLKNHELDKSNKFFLLNLGRLYNDNHYFDKGLKFYLIALNLDTTIAETYNQIGISYSNLQDYKKASFYFKKTIEKDPTYVYAYDNLAGNYYDLNDLDNAMSYFKQSLKIKDKGETYANIGLIYNDKKEYDSAIFYNKKAIELIANKALYYNNLGSDYYGIKDYQAAILNFKKAITIDTNYILSYNNLIKSYVITKNYVEAIKITKRLINKKPKDITTLIDAGLTYQTAQIYEEAAKLFFRALTIDPKNILAINNIANNYHKMGKFNEAISYYQKSIRLNAANAYPYLGLAKIYTKKGDRLNAIRNYKFSLDKDEDDAEASNQLGILYKEVNKPIQSIAYLIKAAAINEYAYFEPLKASVLANTNKVQSGFEFYLDSLKAKTDVSKAYYVVGLAFYDNKDYQKGLNYFQQSITIDSNAVNSYNMAGIVSIYLEKNDLAKTYFAKIIALDPKNTNSYYNLACLFSLNNDLPESLKNFELSLKNGYKDYDHILADTDFINLKKSPEFTVLIKKYFPDKFE